MALVKDLRENHGVFCSIVVYPVIPKGLILLRMIPTASHTLQDVEETLDAFSAIRTNVGRPIYGVDVCSVGTERKADALLFSMQLQQAEQVFEARRREWQQAWETFNSKAGESRRQAEVEQSRIQHLEKSIERLGERMERLRKEQESLDSGPLAREMREFEEQVAEYQEQREESEMRAESLQEQINQLRRDNGERGRELDEARDQLQNHKNRHTSLEALQKAAMGDDGAVSDWLERHDLDQRPRLADRILLLAHPRLPVRGLKLELRYAFHMVVPRITQTLKRYYAQQLHMTNLSEFERDVERKRARTYFGRRPTPMGYLIDDAAGERKAVRQFGFDPLGLGARGPLRAAFVAARAASLLRSDGFQVEGVVTLFNFTWSGGRARLEADGVITGYHAAVAPARLGRPVQAVLHLQVDRARYGRSLERILELDEVLVCHRTTGSSSLLMIVAVASMEALEALIDHAAIDLGGGKLEPV